MPKTKKVVFEEQVDGENWLVGEIFYSKGGINYFSGGSDKRGYWFSVQPEQRKPDGLRSIIMFSGTKILLKEAKRFSEKELAGLTVSEEKIVLLKSNVLAKSKIFPSDLKGAASGN